MKPKWIDTVVILLPGSPEFSEKSNAKSRVQSLILKMGSRNSTDIAYFP